MLQKHVENTHYVNLLTKGQQMLTYHFFVKFEFENVSELSLDWKACLERNIERKLNNFSMFYKFKKVLVSLCHERGKEIIDAFEASLNTLVVGYTCHVIPAPGWYDSISDNPKIETDGSKKFFFEKPVFWSLSVFVFEESKSALLFCHIFLFQKQHHIYTIWASFKPDITILAPQTQTPSGFKGNSCLVSCFWWVFDIHDGIIFMP